MVLTDVFYYDNKSHSVSGAQMKGETSNTPSVHTGKLFEYMCQVKLVWTWFLEKVTALLRVINGIHPLATTAKLTFVVRFANILR